ncbi:MAG: DUF4405 domain-containing protein [Synergistaceae bacterium]|nr:DUF4405 domain-containing protein [Synergistaceae bacterium]
MLRPIIDILMTVILLLTMSYELIGVALSEIINFDGYEYGSLIHEFLGISLVILFFFHLWLNRWWLKTLFKGRYNLTRIILTSINFALIIDMVLLTFAGMYMSRLVETPETDSLMSFSRICHVTASYWGFILMSFHAGLNWHIFSAMMFKKMKIESKIIPHIIAIIIMIYGAYAFIKRNFWDYMSMNILFVFFDYEEPFMYFILDYVAIMFLFGSLGHYLFLMLKKPTKKF